MAAAIHGLRSMQAFTVRPAMIRMEIHMMNAAKYLAMMDHLEVDFVENAFRNQGFKCGFCTTGFKLAVVVDECVVFWQCWGFGDG